MTDLSQYTVLVVDDDPDTLDFIGAVLEDNGATVLLAHNGDQALDMVREHGPDLVTLDIQMPGKDGGQVFDEMRRDPEMRDTPVCIISGKPELRRLIYQRTVPPPDGFLDKPIDEDRLLLSVKKILFVGHGRS